MTPECTHVLRNGQKCRAAATRNQVFCRHHGPRLDGPPSPRRRHLNPAHAKWRALGRNLRWLAPREIPFAIHHILDSMLLPRRDRLSDLVAGRYLRLLLLRQGSVPFPAPGIGGPQPPAPPSPATGSCFSPEVRAAMDAACLNTTTETIEKLLAAFEKSGIVTAEMLAEYAASIPQTAAPSGPQLVSASSTHQ